MDYNEFLSRKAQLGGNHGFKPVWVPDFLFDFQKAIIDWAVLKGRGAVFADCGLGKTPMELVWAENVVRHTNKPVLILNPLAVSFQTLREAEKFGIEVERSVDGNFKKKIVITNYERLHYFNAGEFVGCACDESSILKNFDGTRKTEITEFMKKLPYRSLWTATAAPNDYIELGTSAEALGVMGYMDMLNRFFKNDQNTSDTKKKWSNHGGGMPKWRFKKHAEEPFWRWVCSWARAVRRPSDMGFDDTDFVLPELVERETVVDCSRPLPGKLFVEPAQGLKEQREERRATLNERCEAVADKVNGNSVALVWCNLNDEGDLLERIIPDAVQVAGKHSDDEKEERLLAFAENKIRVLITKPKVAGFGLNYQNCAHTTFFPSHSYEQYYQGIRRMWRFGQTKPVIVDIITTKGEFEVLKNLQRKAKQADQMFSKLVQFMNHAITIDNSRDFNKQEEIPTWLS
jgi:hypothetical protein